MRRPLVNFLSSEQCGAIEFSSCPADLARPASITLAVPIPGRVRLASTLHNQMDGKFDYANH